MPSQDNKNPLALNLYLLGYNSDGNLVSPNDALKENIRTYLSQFRMLTDAISINATAGGMDITSAGVMDITTSASNSNITIDPNGSGTLALGSADNTAVTVDALAVTLTSVNALTLP